MFGRPRESKVSNALYEHVVTKNFEIIENLLSKFHEVFLSNFFSMQNKTNFKVHLLVYSIEFQLLKRIREKCRKS